MIFVYRGVVFTTMNSWLSHVVCVTTASHTLMGVAIVLNASVGKTNSVVVVELQ